MVQVINLQLESKSISSSFFVRVNDLIQIIKSLGIALFIFLQSMPANSNSYVRGSQYMLNQLGYAAGTEDGIKGKNT